MAAESVSDMAQLELDWQALMELMELLAMEPLASAAGRLPPLLDLTGPTWPIRPTLVLILTAMVAGWAALA